MLVFIEQRHIDAAGRKSCNCPIALALMEQLGLEGDGNRKIPVMVNPSSVLVSFTGALYDRSDRHLPGAVRYTPAISAIRFVNEWDGVGSYGMGRRGSPCVVELIQTPVGVTEEI